METTFLAADQCESCEVATITAAIQTMMNFVRLAE